MFACLHRNISLWQGSACWNFTDEVAVSGSQSTINLDEGIRIFCSDCELEKPYRYQTAPKWVQHYMNYISKGGAQIDIEAATAQRLLNY